MFSPIRWIRPRLKSLCVAFGAADLTLVLLSALGWYVFFDIGFQAQQDHILLEYRRKPDTQLVVTVEQEKQIMSLSGQTRLLPLKNDRTEEENRLRRTVRACGYVSGSENGVDQNFAAPSALIGASMGGYAIIGSLLISLSLLHNAAGKKVICTICLAGEGVCTAFLFISNALLLSNDGLCPAEYYFESFQPIFHLFVYSLIFISSYKTYEITVIIFYLMEQSKLARKEIATDNALRRSINLPPVDESQSEWEMANEHPSEHDQ